jgi:hypothetical protein
MVPTKKQRVLPHEERWSSASNMVLLNPALKLIMLAETRAWFNLQEQKLKP